VIKFNSVNSSPFSNVINSPIIKKLFRLNVAIDLHCFRPPSPAQTSKNANDAAPHTTGFIQFNQTIALNGFLIQLHWSTVFFTDRSTMPFTLPFTLLFTLPFKPRYD
jgi:hypothetical protein